MSDAPVLANRSTDRALLAVVGALGEALQAAGMVVSALAAHASPPVPDAVCVLPPRPAADPSPAPDAEPFTLGAA